MPAGPLRILHVVPTYWPAVRYGGPIRSVHGLAVAQRCLGHDVHVYTTSMDGPGDLAVPLNTAVNVDGVQVWYFRVPRFRRLHVAPGLARQLRREITGFDVVHLHSVFLWPTWKAARAAEQAGVPYIVAPRGMLVRKIIRRRSRWLKLAWLALIERHTLEHAARLHVTALGEADELRAQHFGRTPIVTIPNGVTFPQSPQSLDQGPFKGLPRRYALFLSRISWKKGLDRLIRAWQTVPDLPLVIVGNDDEGYQHRLEALVRELGLAASVLFAGPASDEHKWALYTQAELFVLPSYSENFGIVVAEAMAMGCPVIVTPDVGASELVAQAGAGLITSGEPEQLAATVRRLLADPGARRAQGQAGREFARTQLSWEGIARRTCEMYRDALQAC
jgi:glycosyltransferase involved in cell wall biosynthesis